MQSAKLEKLVDILMDFWLNGFPKSPLVLADLKAQPTKLEDLSLPPWSWASCSGPVKLLKLDPLDYGHQESCSVLLKDSGIITLIASILPVLQVGDFTLTSPLAMEDVRTPFSPCVGRRSSSCIRNG
ncbi:MAG: hypothetical protein M1839_008266 [Geoglossum umbratile]|nr:MAG: hypothetical protein M1839_008266 [Geoglossum umbratile]